MAMTATVIEQYDRRLVGAWMSTDPFTIGDDQSLADARKRMHAHGVRHLAVLHGGHLVGVISSRDIATVESLPDLDLELVTVRDAMAEEPWTVTAERPLAEVAAAMAEQRIGTAMVVDTEGSDTLVGVFTTTDGLRALASFAG